jgi:histidinol dehydrogenase
MPQFLSTTDADFETRFTAVLNAKREDSPDVDAVVAGIIADVRTRGDAALIDLTSKFDRMRVSSRNRTCRTRTRGGAHSCISRTSDARGC